MCGIVGFITPDYKKFKERKDFLTQAIFADTLRGAHSTGVFSVSSNKEVNYFKKAVSGPDFLEMKGTDRILNKDGRIMVGHNRWATMGSHINANAHPFYIGSIVGVHNGTLTGNWRHYLPAGNDWNVDSQAIMNALAVEPYKEVLEKLEGAFTLAWYDERDEKFRIVRNSERPIHIAKIADSGAHAFASEKLMLEWLLARNGLKVEKIYSPEPGEIFTFDHKNLSEFTVEKVTVKKKVEAVSHFDRRLPQRGGSNSSLTHKKKSILSFLDLNITSKASYTYDLEGWTKYSYATDDTGYLYGYMRGLKDINGDRIKCVIHSVGFKEIPTICPSGIKYTSVNGTAHVLSPMYADRDESRCTVLIKDKASFFDNKAKILDDAEEKDEKSKITVVVRGPTGDFISDKSFKKAVKDGCIVCGDPISLDQADNILWTTDHQPICDSSECQKSAITEFNLDLLVH